MGRKPLAPGSVGEVSSRMYGNRWVARVSCRRPDGEIVRPERSGTSKAAAEAAVIQVARDLSGLSFRRGSLRPESPFSALIEERLARMSEDDVEDTTRNESARVVRVHILSHSIARLPVRAVDATAAAELYRGLSSVGKYATAKQVLIELRKVLDLGVELGLTRDNPARAFNPPRRRRNREIFAPGAMELGELREVVAAYIGRAERMGPKPSTRLLDVIDTLMGTGARISEALGLQWAHIHLDEEVPTVEILGAVIEGHGVAKHYRAYPKSESGFRRIPIPDFLVETLRQRPRKGKFVFATSSGAPMGPQDVHRALRQVRAWSQATDGVPSISDAMVPHALRRSVATAIARESGGLDDAAVTLGHSRSRVTEKHYAKRVKDTPDRRDVLQGLGRPQEPSTLT